MPQAMLFTTVLVLICVLIHYEVLRLNTHLLPRLPVMPRYRIISVLVFAFVGHTIEVWLFGVAYWLMAGHLGLGTLAGDFDGSLVESVYFSAVTYSTLGFGDVYPTGALRLVSGVEALLGLVLVGWTTSYTYLAMRELWDLHGK